MISIVVCSLHENLLKQLKDNIAQTIGVSFEVLVWQNKEAALGICEVYNRVATNASFPFILFLHEDVSFDSINWGKNLIDFFHNDKHLGLVGVAGSRYKAKSFSGWYTGKNEIDVYSVIHKNGEQTDVLKNVNNKQNRQPVVCIDGVFMMCRKEVWQEVKFNEDLLKGFHFYDIDFSVRVAEKWQVMVVSDVELVHHTTGGDFGDKWVEQAFIYHSGTPTQLPMSIGSIPDNMEMTVAKCWLDWLKGKKISFSNRLRWVAAQKLYVYPQLWYSIFKFFAYRHFGLGYFHKFIKPKG
jgi:Glycosyltransferase like family